MSIRILIVDDACFMRRSLASILAERGWEVIGEAANGLEALEKYEALHPDVVTMDVTMPRMDGLTALRSLLGKHPSARVVMCSSLGQLDVISEAARRGARDFLIKPYRKQRVLGAISKAMGLV